MKKAIIFQSDFDPHFCIDRRTGISMQEAMDLGITFGSELRISSKKFFVFVAGTGFTIIFGRPDPRKVKKLLRRTGTVASKKPQKILKNMSEFV
jgi:hypothetical protein